MNIPGSTNYLTTYCNPIRFDDVWTDSQDTCETIFGGYFFKSIVSNVKDGSAICMPISADEIGCVKEDTPDCYVRNYMERYNYNNLFIVCNVPQLIKGDPDITSPQWFLNNIQLYLLYAKNAEYFQKDLMSILDDYKLEVSNFSHQVKIYTDYLDIVYNQYQTLVSEFENIKSNFEGNAINHNVYLLDYLDCGKYLLMQDLLKRMMRHLH
jgi:hypothetical protein